MHPRRGEVWWVSFDSSVGGEIQKTRPAVVMSNDSANAALNRVIVIPLTSQVAKLYPGEAMIVLNGEQRKAMADQIMAASKHRLKSKRKYVLYATALTFSCRPQNRTTQTAKRKSRESTAP